MYGQISTLAFVGIEARPVEVQVRISGGAGASGPARSGFAMALMECRWPISRA